MRRWGLAWSPSGVGRVCIQAKAPGTSSAGRARWASAELIPVAGATRRRGVRSARGGTALRQALLVRATACRLPL